MRVGSEKWFSNNLRQDMELKIYGHAGKPIVVFPAQEGNFNEYEGFGMIEACRNFIENGKIQVFTIDGIDRQAWVNKRIHPAHRAIRYNQYESYLIEEVVPFIHHVSGYNYNKFLATGCSMGGYHSANFFFRHPEVFDSLIALSGVYTLKLFIDDYMDEQVFYHTPLAYLSGLNDSWYLDQYRQSQIVVCVGQGPWEDDMIVDTKKLKSILEHKNVPCWVDFWGKDVEHDWPWWRKQMPYFLNHLNLDN